MGRRINRDDLWFKQDGATGSVGSGPTNMQIIFFKDNLTYTKESYESPKIFEDRTVCKKIAETDLNFPH